MGWLWPGEMITHVNWLSENVKSYARMALLNGHLSIFACSRMFVTLTSLGVLL